MRIGIFIISSIGGERFRDFERVSLRGKNYPRAFLHVMRPFAIIIEYNARIGSWPAPHCFDLGPIPTLFVLAPWYRTMSCRDNTLGI